MPIFTNPISNQNTSYSAGNLVYPNLGQSHQYSIVSDFFTRNDVNPTNAVLYYNSAVVGTGTSSIIGGNSMKVNTSTTINDCVCNTVLESFFNRTVYFVDAKSNLNLDIICTPANLTTTSQGFIGLQTGGGSLTALPVNTNVCMGIKWDTNVDTNIYITSSDGTTITSTSTGLANNNRIRLNINWISDTLATITVYLASSPNTPILSKNVTINFIPVQPATLTFFILTLGASSRYSIINEWRLLTT